MIAATTPPAPQVLISMSTPSRQRVEALEGVDRLRGRLVDVDQALVRADLEVIARVLVLNGPRITQ